MVSNVKRRSASWQTLKLMNKINKNYSRHGEN